MVANAWDEYLTLADKGKVEAAALPAVLHPLLKALQSPGHVEPPPEVRRRLLGHLLSTLSFPPNRASSASTSLDPTSPPSLLLPVISLIKVLGRSAAGSEEIGRKRGLSTLLAYGGLSRVATQLKPRIRFPPRASQGLGISELSEDDDEELVDALQTPRVDLVIDDDVDPLTPSESEALRTLCNVLILHPSAREIFGGVVSEDKHWLTGLVRLLGVKSAGFLTGRLLFLLTSKPGDWIMELVEAGEAVAIMEEFARKVIDRLRTPRGDQILAQGVPSQSDILREHLKLAYNLMLQYGRLPPMRSRQSSVASTTTDDDDISETDGSEAGSRPSSPLPGSASKAKKFGLKNPFSHSSSSNGGPTSTSAASEDSPSITSSPTLGAKVERRSSLKRSKSPRLLAQKFKSAVRRSSQVPPPLPAPVSIGASVDAGGSFLTVEQVNPFLPLFQPYLTISVLLPVEPKGTHTKDPSPLLRSALNTLLNFPLELEEIDGYTYSWLQPVEGATIAYDSLPALPSRLLEVLQWTFDAWFPTDVYGKSIDGQQSKVLPSPPDELVPRGGGEAARAEEIIAPIMLLTRKLSLLTEAGDAYKELLLPANRDRTLGPEQQPNMLGTLVRLLGSILFPNTSYGAGELLYNLCDRDASILSSQLGYGNVAGFLQNRGELVPPPSTSADAASSSAQGEEGKTVNPITGAYERKNPQQELKDMTDEEKEREAERLYVLFDRMSKTGVMNVENPVHKAKAEGKFEENAREEQRKLQEQEEREEEEALEEMRRYKERKQHLADQVATSSSA